MNERVCNCFADSGTMIIGARDDWRIVPRLVKKSDLVQLVRLAAFVRAVSVLAKPRPEYTVVFESSVDRNLRANHLAGALGLFFCATVRARAAAAA